MPSLTPEQTPPGLPAPRRRSEHASEAADAFATGYPAGGFIHLPSDLRSPANPSAVGPVISESFSRMILDGVRPRAKGTDELVSLIEDLCGPPSERELRGEHRAVAAYRAWNGGAAACGVSGAGYALQAPARSQRGLARRSAARSCGPLTPMLMLAGWAAVLAGAVSIALSEWRPDLLAQRSPVVVTDAAVHQPFHEPLPAESAPGQSARSQPGPGSPGEASAATNTGNTAQPGSQPGPGAAASDPGPAGRVSVGPTSGVQPTPGPHGGPGTSSVNGLVPLAGASADPQAPTGEIASDPSRVESPTAAASAADAQTPALIPVVPLPPGTTSPTLSDPSTPVVASPGPGEAESTGTPSTATPGAGANAGADTGSDQASAPTSEPGSGAAAAPSVSECSAWAKARNRGAKTEFLERRFAELIGDRSIEQVDQICAQVLAEARSRESAGTQLR